MPFRDIVGHAGTLAALQTAIANRRLAHAYLFHGETAIGKRLTAVRFAQALTCDHGAAEAWADACGVCRSCRQIETRTHPDFFLIEPDEEQATPQIKIEQIRDIEHHMVYRPLMSERKICLIDETDRMTIGAANALLKTLEEPPDHSLFLLISSRPASLPATVRSRCQAIRFTTPARTQVEAALIMKREMPPADARLLAMVTEGRIGEALTADPREIRESQREVLELVAPQRLHSISEVLTAAEVTAKADRGPHMLSWLARWIRDLILLVIAHDPDQIVFTDHLPAMEHYARGADIDALIGILSDIERTERQATRHFNLQLALENILFRVRDAVPPPTGQPV
ncbi:MAG TPA: DNA polymerase III subunit delta' [Nitrospira sp.]|nr:DNA polymerase III subunit delta' [Nitrospira sp.]